jgi:hypothetical protein
MQLQHPALIIFLQLAYSTEKAAPFAYIGHAGSVRNPEAKQAIRQIELDEWKHREEVLAIMQQHETPVSRKYEWYFHLVGKLIGYSCYVIGWFMPIYFAGRLESGNVCEYFRMKHYFNELGIHEHDQVLCDMGIKEKEHEVYFPEAIKGSLWLPFFEKLFFWGEKRSYNNLGLEKKYPVEESDIYCKK